MKFENHEVSTIHKMLSQIQEISSDLNEFSQEKQERILDMHNEGHTLQHCLKWGEQALYDILKDIENDRI
jgi:hypothetical protein